MKDMTSEVLSYKCEWCGELYRSELRADECAYNHAKVNYANSLLQSGRNLSTIDYLCGFNWKLTDNNKFITKDHCFIMSHWQCCNKPAYQIVEIDKNGKLKLFGKGSWNGYYGNWITLDRLPEAYDKSELFVDSR